MLWPTGGGGKKALAPAALPLLLALAAVVLAAVAAAAAVAAPAVEEFVLSAEEGGVSVWVDSTGNYSVAYGDAAPWFRNGFVALYAGNNQWYTTRASALNVSADSVVSQLLLEGYGLTTGVDALGNYSRFQLQWRAGAVALETNVTAYGQFVTFTQAFAGGLSDCSLGDASQLVAAFPAFDVADTPLAALNYWTQLGLWDLGTVGVGLDGYSGGLEGGTPLVVYDDAVAAVAVLSPLASFKVGYQGRPTTLGGRLAGGIEAKAEALPPGFVHSSVLYMSGSGGLNATVYEWGSLLLRVGGKQRMTPQVDAAVEFLGYWTDNGAYYYYVTVPGLDYQQTMLAVRDYLAALQLPVRYYQLDSWWYYKANGTSGGVTEWAPQPAVFPDGMAALQAALGTPLVTHNRYWSPATNYSRIWQFVHDGEQPGAAASKYALPTQQGFWDFLLGQARAWGVATYEQDWLVDQFGGMNITLQNVTLAAAWLHQMGAAAAANSITIQYCMPLPSDYLQSTQIQAVTQIRASNDYLHGVTTWNIGRTSLLAWALGLRPFKDTFWSSMDNPGNRYGATEPNPQLVAAISTLSTGPVGFSDGIGFVNVSVIRATCTADGSLLQPAKPATPIDRMWAPGAPAGEVWHTFSSLAGLLWHHLLVIQLNGSLAVAPADLGIDAAAASGVQTWIVTEFHNQDAVVAKFGATAPLALQPMPPPNAAGSLSWALYSLAPVLPDSGWVLLGERAKYTRVAAARFVALRSSSQGFVVSFRGEPGELVILDALEPGSSNVISTVCTIPVQGLQSLTCLGSTCTC